MWPAKSFWQHSRMKKYGPWAVLLLAQGFLFLSFDFPRAHLFFLVGYFWVWALKIPELYRKSQQRRYRMSFLLFVYVAAGRLRPFKFGSWLGALIPPTVFILSAGIFLFDTTAFIWTLLGALVSQSFLTLTGHIDVYAELPVRGNKSASPKT